MRYFFLILCFIFLGCEKETPKFKEYYFDLENFKNPSTYEYENLTNPEETQYWRFSSNEKTNKLTTKTYNSKFEQIELFEEIFTTEGSRLVLYQPIENKIKVKTKVNQGELDVYKWSDLSPYKYSVTYFDKNYGQTIFEKEREFISVDSILIMSKKYECLKFKGNYSFIFKEENQKYNFYQYSYYVKNYGFVRYERFYPDGESSILELTKIYSEKEWTELKNKNLSRE